jgi:flagellar biosynthesis component FlhA
MIMYGKWFLTVFAFGAAILLIVGLMTAFPALAAVAIGGLLGFIVLWVLAARRTRQVGAEHATIAEEQRQAGQNGRPSASGAPRSGEGDAGAAHRARLRGGSR